MNTRHFANIKTSRSILPRWVKNWEDSAGKPYVKPKQLAPDTIRNTVKEAQELLSGMAMHSYMDIIREQSRRLTDDGERVAFLLGCRESYVWPGPPQSLGELCIELAEDAMRLVTTEYNVPPGFWGSWPGEISDLRRAMYHRASAGPMFAKGDGDTK